MPSFSDSIFLFILALLLFGPKRLPVLARELGKWVGEFRRASNEFKMQMEEELRLSEQADRQKKIAAIEAAAPVTPPIPEPEHPHLPSLSVSEAAAMESSDNDAPVLTHPQPLASAEVTSSPSLEASASPAEPLPIATSGDLRLMPPATGLPTPRRAPSQLGAASEFGSAAQQANGSNGTAGDPLGGLLESIPEAPAGAEASSAPETATR